MCEKIHLFYRHQWGKLVVAGIKKARQFLLVGFFVWHWERGGPRGRAPRIVIGMPAAVGG